MNKCFGILLLSLFFFACNNNKKVAAEKTPAKLPPQYYYYPRANVYFDSANKDYVFLANDGTTWQSAKQIPNIVQGLMDKSVPVQNPSEPVWKDNEKHKLVYSALLYATPNDTVEKKEPPKPVMKAGKPVDSSASQPRKKQSGLKRLLNKIFGGLKKEKKDTVGQ